MFLLDGFKHLNDGIWAFFLLSLWFSKPLSATYHFRPIKRTVLKSNQYARRAATKKPKFITKPAKNA